MRFNKHFNLKDRHAFLSPSQYHWIRYDEEKLAARFLNAMNAQRGTELHALAAEMIRLGIRAKASKKTFNMYVNDCIGYRMIPEQTLYYSDNCFGTADAISFDVKKMLLRVFDLKNGVSKASVDQLLVYCAIFCLEYGFKPFELEYDIRLYKDDEVQKFEVDPGDIAHIMSTIISWDKAIDAMKMEV